MAQSFWGCLTLSNECPFISSTDPNLIYFGIGLLAFYIAFTLVNIVDLSFYWSLDEFQSQLDSCINTVRKKVRRVQGDQRRLMSTQERTEKQLQRSSRSARVVTALRHDLDREECKDSLLNNFQENKGFSSSTISSAN